MIGLGTFYNALGVVFGGLLGLLIGQRLSEDFHETLLKVTGVAVFVLGIADAKRHHQSEQGDL